VVAAINKTDIVLARRRSPPPRGRGPQVSRKARLRARRLLVGVISDHRQLGPHLRAVEQVLDGGVDQVGLYRQLAVELGLQVLDLGGDVGEPQRGGLEDDDVRLRRPDGDPAHPSSSMISTLPLPGKALGSLSLAFALTVPRDPSA
jgi:hypothetical protein